MSSDDNISQEQEGLVDKLAKIKDKVLQNKPARYSLALCFLLFAILLFLPILINNDALKGSSVKKLREVFGHDIFIKGSVSIEILPTPKIIARDILIFDYHPKNSKYNYNVFAKRAEVKLKFFYSSKSSIIKEIKFAGVVAEKRHISSNSKGEAGTDIKNIKIHLKNKYGDSEAKIDKSISGFNFESLSLTNVSKSDFSLKKFPRIKITDARVITYDIYDNKREYKSLNCVVDVSNNKIKSDGYFAVEGILTSFESKLVFDKDLKDNKNSFLQIKSPSLNFRFDGNLSSSKGLDEDYAIKGSIVSEIKDLRDFYLSYVGAKSAFSSKLKKNTPLIKLSAKISSDKDGSFVEKLKIKSPIINGSGTISTYKSSTIPIIDVLLDIKDVDIDSIWSTTSIKSDEDREPIKNNLIFGIDKVETFKIDSVPEILKKDFDLTLEIKSNLVIYKSTPLSGLNIYLSSHNYGQLIFNPISFKFPGNGKFHANGELNSSGGVPRFSGKVNISGDSPQTILGRQSSSNGSLNLDFISRFHLYSDLTLSPSKMDLDNLFININDKETEISGDLSYAIVDKKPFFKGDFRINEFNIKDQVKNFNIAKYTKKGSLIEKVFWLNDLSYETSMRLKLDRINYGSEEFFDNSLKLKIKRGSVELSDIVIDPKSHNSRANFLIDISQSTPKLEIKISAKKLSMFSEEIKSEKPQYISEKEGAQSYESNPVDQHALLRKDTVDEFLNIVSLNGFSGEIKFDIQRLLFKNKLLEKFRFHSKLNNGILDNVLIQAGIGNTGFQYQGLIGLKKVKTLSGTATLKNFKIQPIATDLFNVSNIDTTLNSSIAVSSFGDNAKSFTENLDGELKFNAVAPLVKGYGLRDLVRKMFFPKKNYDELKEVGKIVENVDAKTRFKKASGSIIFKEGNANINSKVKGILSNSVLSGTIGMLDKEVALVFNTVFVTGSKKKLTPISIATNIHGSIGNLAYASNYDQIMQYLGIKKVDKGVDESVTNSDEQTDVEKDKDINEENKKRLEKNKKQMSNKANSALRRQGIYLPPQNDNHPADYMKQIQPAN